MNYKKILVFGIFSGLIICTYNKNKILDEKINLKDIQIAQLEKELDTLYKETKESDNTILSLEKEINEIKTTLNTITNNINKETEQITITATFYGDFAYENGGYAGLDANGNKLIAGTVASNYYPQGTKFYYKDMVFTVRDKGGKNFNDPDRLDIFVPRKHNESDEQYAKRIEQYGRKTLIMEVKVNKNKN